MLGRIEAVTLDSIALHIVVDQSDPHQVGDSNETGFPGTEHKQCWYCTADAL